MNTTELRITTTAESEDQVCPFFFKHLDLFIYNMEFDNCEFTTIICHHSYQAVVISTLFETNILTLDYDYTLQY